MSIATALQHVADNAGASYNLSQPEAKLLLALLERAERLAGLVGQMPIEHGGFPTSDLHRAYSALTNVAERLRGIDPPCSWMNIPRAEVA